MSETEFIYVDIDPKSRFRVQISNFNQFVISKQVMLSTYDPLGQREWKVVPTQYNLNGAFFVNKDEKEVKALCSLIEKLNTFIRAQPLK